MKLVRYGPKGREKPGLIDADGKVRDLSRHLYDTDHLALSEESLQKFRSIDPGILGEVEGTHRFGVPLRRVGKCVCIGLNYSDHAAETNSKPPKEPIIFMKATTSICGPNDDTVTPRMVPAMPSLKRKIGLTEPIASLITPALKSGGFIKGRVPADVAEADQSQSGKTYRQKVIAALYNEQLSLVTSREGGVGSIDESLNQALVAGRPFIQFDNFRGRFESAHLEAFLTAEGSFPCRVPHRVPPWRRTPHPGLSRGRVPRSLVPRQDTWRRGQRARGGTPRGERPSAGRSRETREP